MGFTLNMLTMLALTLSVGIVIDDAIVVLENIYRFIEEKGMPPMQAAVEATREIGLAVLATTMSLVAIFVPVAFMNGIIGRFMASFGLTMAFAILVSLVVSFTLTPTMSARWLKLKRPTDDKDHHIHDSKHSRALRPSGPRLCADAGVGDGAPRRHRDAGRFWSSSRACRCSDSCSSTSPRRTISRRST
jgi:HAE1 family hydrophobic/amphiphilic exporter-1